MCFYLYFLEVSKNAVQNALVVPVLSLYLSCSLVVERGGRHDVPTLQGQGGHDVQTLQGQAVVVVVRVGVQYRRLD